MSTAQIGSKSGDLSKSRYSFPLDITPLNALHLLS